MRSGSAGAALGFTTVPVNVASKNRDLARKQGETSVLNDHRYQRDGCHRGQAQVEEHHGCHDERQNSGQDAREGQ